jgi:hypothetical protein
MSMGRRILLVAVLIWACGRPPTTAGVPPTPAPSSVATQGASASRSTIPSATAASFPTESPSVSPIFPPVVTPGPDANKPGSRIGTIGSSDGTRLLAIGGGPPSTCAQFRDQLTWNGTGFVPVLGSIPFGAGGAVLAYDPALNRTILFDSVGETWLWDGTAWSMSSAIGPPKQRAFPCSDAGPTVISLNYSPSMRRVILLDETVYDQQGSLEVWSGDGSSWAILSRTVITSAGPPSGIVPATAWDPISNQLIMFGGVKPMTQAPAPNDMWAWSGTWSQIKPTHLPPSDWGGQAMTIDPTTNQVLMLDGSQTWTWTGSDWQQVASTVPGPPPFASSGLLAADPVHNQVIFAFGCTQYCEAPYPKFLVWDGLSWSAQG